MSPFGLTLTGVGGGGASISATKAGAMGVGGGGASISAINLVEIGVGGGGASMSRTVPVPLGALGIMTAANASAKRNPKLLSFMRFFSLFCLKSAPWGERRIGT